MSGMISAPLLCWIAVSPIILFKNSKVPPELYGVVQIPIFGFYILGNAVLRRMTYKRSLTEIIRIGFPICFIGMASMSVLTYFFTSSYWSIILPLSFYCLGNGMISAPLTRQALYSSSEAKGSVSAVYGFISTAVLIGSISSMSIIFHDNNLEFGLFCLGCIFVLAALLKWFLSGTTEPELS
jgi:DHA1 family multidrug/chloramphenicol efflux transport protein-like MFS transporter